MAYGLCGYSIVYRKRKRKTCLKKFVLKQSYNFDF